MTQSNLKISDILSQLLIVGRKDNITFGEILNVVSDKGFNILMIIFSIPNIIPLPGLSTITGIPLIILSIQIILGYQKPSLPAFLKSKSIKYELFEKLINLTIKYLRKFEFIFKPRLLFLTNSSSRIFLGILLLTSSSILTLPIIFANLIPTTSIILISIGYLYKDGIIIIAGIIASLLSILIVSGIVFIGFEAINIFIKNFF